MSKQKFVIHFILCCIITALTLPPFVRWLDSLDPAPLGIECCECMK